MIKKKLAVGWKDCPAMVETVWIFELDLIFLSYRSLLLGVRWKRMTYTFVMATILITEKDYGTAFVGCPVYKIGRADAQRPVPTSETERWDEDWGSLETQLQTVASWDYHGRLWHGVWSENGLSYGISGSVKSSVLYKMGGSFQTEKDWLIVNPRTTRELTAAEKISDRTMMMSTVDFAQPLGRDLGRWITLIQQVYRA